ncbi:MAG: VanZ family protein [Gammaproteobacteria bacterium]|nr:VanZ family protein [Gammaproteobacteria bacterium]MDH5175630.1 VanZ family protein [Gammaproteobacteria bacterium]
MLPLRYRAFWIAASLAMVVIVIWGSLQTAFATPPVQGFDKVEHFLTYMFLAVWFTGLFVRPHWWRIVAGLLALGLAMEIGQYLMHAGRMADPLDMAANTAGVAAGVGLALLLTGAWAQKIESWLRKP